MTPSCPTRTKRFVALGTALIALAAPLWAQSVTDYLTPDEAVNGTSMRIVASPELAALTEQLRAAVAQHQEWFAQYVERYAVPGEPLPFHPNFGLSQTEYERYLDLVDVGFILEPVAPIRVRLTEIVQDHFVLATSPLSSPLAGLGVSPRGIGTPYGNLTEIAPVNQTNPNSPTGRWQGIEWSAEVWTDEGLWAASFAIGRRTDAGDGIIYYRLQSLGPEARSVQEIVLFPINQ